MSPTTMASTLVSSAAPCQQRVLEFFLKFPGATKLMAYDALREDDRYVTLDQISTAIAKLRKKHFLREERSHRDNLRSRRGGAYASVRIFPVVLSEVKAS